MMIHMLSGEGLGNDVKRCVRLMQLTGGYMASPSATSKSAFGGLHISPERYLKF
ncbi:MAG: hypothetical protein MW689_001644 [Thermodesulfobacteria bacterium]|nr:hypothetical protein [Thermodesulfobacteriota bacterium]